MERQHDVGTPEDTDPMRFGHNGTEHNGTEHNGTGHNGTGTTAPGTTAPGTTAPGTTMRSVGATGSAGRIVRKPRSIGCFRRCGTSAAGPGSPI